MSSVLQTIFSLRKIKKVKPLTAPKLKNNPQKRAVCLRILTISPKKPNSANRRVIKANVLHYKTRLTAKIPGESHTLQQHAIVLIKGARVRDLIGVGYSAIRGKYDLACVLNRKTSRSCYGAKKFK